MIEAVWSILGDVWLDRMLSKGARKGVRITKLVDQKVF